MKKKNVAALLSLFLGGIGAHRFYLGQPLKGIFYLLFVWTYIPSIIGLIESILFFSMSDDKFNIKYNLSFVKDDEKIIDYDGYEINNNKEKESFANNDIKSDFDWENIKNNINVSIGIDYSNDNFNFGPIKNVGVNKWILNPEASFQLTLLETDENTAKVIKSILDNENNLSYYEKEELIIGIFAEKNIKVKEIEDYKLKYKPIYFKNIEGLISHCDEWDELGEKDKEDVMKEFKGKSITGLEEQPFCDLDILFENEPINIYFDDELIQEFGYKNISVYLRFSNNIDKIRVFSKNDYSRPYFDNLVENGLAVNGYSMSLEEIFSTLTLKELNSIINDPDKEYKRKKQAIDVISNMDVLDDIISKNISLKSIFKLLPLPEKYCHIPIKNLSDTISYHQQEAKLLIDTYDTTLWVKKSLNSFSDNDEFVYESLHSSDCICSSIFKDSVFSKQNSPIFPRHIGGRCYIHTYNI